MLVSPLFLGFTKTKKKRII